MKHEIKNWLRSKKAVIGIGATALLITTGVFQHKLNVKISNISALKSNLATCFSRVNQSYTAKVIGDANSMYLETGFMKTTEECLSEVNTFSQEVFASSAVKLGQALNALISDIHWFHERVEESSSSFSDKDAEVILSNLSDRFEKLEMKYDNVDGELISKEGSISLSKSNLTIFLITLCFIAPLLLLWDFAQRRTLEQRNKYAEDEARKRMESTEAIAHNEVATIIKDALEQNKLVYCSKLFTQYHTLSALNPLKEDSTRIQAMVTPENLTEQAIDDIWNQSESDDSLVLSAEGETRVEEESYSGAVAQIDKSLTKVVNHLSNKLLAEGVIIDLDIAEDLTVRGEDEALEQVVYNVIMNAVKNCQQNDETGRVSISAKRVGTSVIINLTDSGLGFSKDFLSAVNGLADLDEHMPLSLQISRELLEDAGGDISFENTYRAGEVCGSKVQIVMRSAEAQSKRVASVQSGTKKEILEAMKQQTI
ncbi:ATP-binding protein [Halobacteriovorax marinus]|uniref:ATP-binding protein n=1 Tax=Halobacteriovorax marinus TaxID=97084 RepID=UPI003A914980